MVFLDASAIIYLLEGDAPTQAAARETLGRLRTVAGEDPPVVVSALSRLECRVRPLRDGDAALLATYDDFFSEPGLLVVPLANEVIDRATELRAEYGLRTPDALQAACALALDDSIRFVTGDKDFINIPHLTVYRIELPR